MMLLSLSACAFNHSTFWLGLNFVTSSALTFEISTFGAVTPFDGLLILLLFSSSIFLASSLALASPLKYDELSYSSNGSWFNCFAVASTCSHTSFASGFWLKYKFFITGDIPELSLCSP